MSASKKRPRLSVYIITSNEEERLERTLNALKGVVDEIVLVDSGSGDKTVEIARGFGARVYFRTWDNYSSQKKYAESLCSGEWLLNLDADEELTKELGEEILKAVMSEDYKAFRLKIADVFPGKQRPHPWVRCYKVIRLYKRGYASMGETYTWDRVGLQEKETPVGLLKEFVYHHSVLSIRQAVAKYNSYTDQQVEASVVLGKSYSPWRMVGAMSFNFFRYYVLHRRFLNGFWGFIDSVNLSYMRFLKFAKHYERSMRL